MSKRQRRADSSSSRRNSELCSGPCTPSHSDRSWEFEINAFTPSIGCIGSNASLLFCSGLDQANHQSKSDFVASVSVEPLHVVQSSLLSAESVHVELWSVLSVESPISSRYGIQSTSFDVIVNELNPLLWTTRLDLR